jgi:hypothetical protein
MPTNSKASSDEIWKEKLAFTSGSILVWGFFLLQLRSIAASFQTGYNIHFWRSFSIQRGEVTTELDVYLILLFFLTLGIWTILFALLHVICRGLWLVVSGEGNIESRSAPIRNGLSYVSHESYKYVFILSSVVICLIFAGFPLVIISIGLQALLVKQLHLSISAAGYIAFLAVPILTAMIVGLPIILTVKHFHQKDKKSKRDILKSLSKLISRRTILLWVVVWPLFLLSLCAVMETTNKIELSINRKVSYRSQDKSLEVYVSLGGSSSSPREARLTILSPDLKPLKEMVLQDVGQGQYVSQVALEELQPGIYQIDLDYPHASATLSPPSLQLATKRSEKFLIAP